MCSFASKGLIECYSGSTARTLPSQGATGWCRCGAAHHFAPNALRLSPTARPSRAQGATEYLVLFAVVLIIALVSIAILGFFQGTASDSQIAENEIYWEGASPLAIVGTGGAYYAEISGGARGFNPSVVYFRLRNTGSYPIRLSKIMGGFQISGGQTVRSYVSSYHDYGVVPSTTNYLTSIHIYPGEEVCFGAPGSPGASCPEHTIFFFNNTDPGNNMTLWAPNIRICDSSGGGTLVVPDFGFEYISYVEGQAITKAQIGKPLMAKCIGVNAM